MPGAEEIPNVVYHYTSMETLLKIVESRTIWATNIRYLNDISERSHFLKVIKARIEQQPSSIAELFSSAFSDDSVRVFHDLPFVASFSHERDSLSQWRSYCPNGNGVSMGFSTDSLRRGFIGNPSQEEKISSQDLNTPIPDAEIVFDAVRYLQQDDARSIDSIIEQVIKKTRQLVGDDNSQGYSWIDDDGNEHRHIAEESDLMWFALDREASRTKHDSFAAEREYRLLVTIFFNLRQINYRSSKSTLVPFIPVQLPDPVGLDLLRHTPISRNSKPLFIESVTIGPTPHPSLSKGALEGLFSGRNIDVAICNSEIPFRDW